MRITIFAGVCALAFVVAISFLWSLTAFELIVVFFLGYLTFIKAGEQTT